VCRYVCMYIYIYIYIYMKHTVVMNGYRKADWHAEAVRYRLKVRNEYCTL